MSVVTYLNSVKVKKKKRNIKFLQCAGKRSLPLNSIVQATCRLSQEHSSFLLDVSSYSTLFFFISLCSNSFSLFPSSIPSPFSHLSSHIELKNILEYCIYAIKVKV